MRRVTQIGAAKRNPDGSFWPSGWRQPDVRAGLATWEQGDGPDGEGEVHVYDLERGVDRIVRQGHPQGASLVAGPTVVWPESLAPGQLTRMLAANPRTGASVPPPPTLAPPQGGGGVRRRHRSFAEDARLWSRQVENGRGRAGELAAVDDRAARFAHLPRHIVETARVRAAVEVGARREHGVRRFEDRDARGREVRDPHADRLRVVAGQPREAVCRVREDQRVGA